MIWLMVSLPSPNIIRVLEQVLPTIIHITSSTRGRSPALDDRGGRVTGVTVVLVSLFGDTFRPILAMFGALVTRLII